MAEDGSPSESTEQESVGAIIERYSLRIRTISKCAVEHLQFAQKCQEEWSTTLSTGLRLFKSDEGFAIHFTTNEHREEFLTRFTTSRPEIIAQSLMILGFSSLDAFIGLLLKRLYRESDELIYKADEKEIKVGELLSCSGIEEAIGRVIDRDISSLIRNSYDQMFSMLANRFGLSTLKKFPNYPKFIEASQRRNLVTHCDGIVNQQYISACENAEFPLSKETRLGEKLSVDDSYLLECLDLLYEVGVKLGYTLWRKALPEQNESSEIQLTDELFRLLTREQWGLAITMGEFAMQLPGKRLDLQGKIARINYAQALKWSGKHKEALDVINKVDWSGSIRDLRLGVEVIREDFQAAANLMREIGKKGEIVVERGYRDWPLFRDFRKSAQFRQAFQDVYDEEFLHTIDEEHENRKSNKTENNSVALESPSEELTMPPKQPNDEENKTRDETTARSISLPKE